MGSRFVVEDVLVGAEVPEKQVLLALALHGQGVEVEHQGAGYTSVFWRRATSEWRRRGRGHSAADGWRPSRAVGLVSGLGQVTGLGPYRPAGPVTGTQLSARMAPRMREEAKALEGYAPVAGFGQTWPLRARPAMPGGDEVGFGRRGGDTPGDLRDHVIDQREMRTRRALLPPGPVRRLGRASANTTMTGGPDSQEFRADPRAPLHIGPGAAIVAGLSSKGDLNGLYRSVLQQHGSSDFGFFTAEMLRSVVRFGW